MPTLDPRGEYLTRVWRDAVYPLAERLGVKMRLPPLQPRSRRAHEAAQWARAQNRFDDYNDAIFRAFFERGGDIGDVGVLARLASELGLDAAGLSGALERRDFEASVLRDESMAEELGVSGVPAFIAGGRAILFGVQSASGLRELVARVRAAEREEAVTPLQHLPLSITGREGEE